MADDLDAQRLPLLPKYHEKPQKSRLSKLASLLSGGISSWLLVIFVAGILGKAVFFIVDGLFFQANPKHLPQYDVPPAIAHNLGPYTARYPVQSFGPYKIDAALPEGCTVTQVNILGRHGARYPTSGQSINSQASIEKLKVVVKPTEDLAFMTSYEWEFDENDLIPFGRKQAFVAGRQAAQRYKHLIQPSGSNIFVRTTNKARVLATARWFKQGFIGGSFNVEEESTVLPDLTIPIGPKFQNPLEPRNCEAGEPEDHDDIDIRLPRDTPEGELPKPRQWLALFGTAAAARLNEALPGANLTYWDIKYLMTICGFETANNEGQHSPWCDVFTEEEWRAHEYYWDLERYWLHSYGSKHSATKGSGWVTELVARLRGVLATDYPSKAINRTLDGDPSTFPVSPNAPSIFADFTSDGPMTHIMTALHILKDPYDLPPKGPIPKDRMFVTSKMTPFASHLAVEKLECSKARFYDPRTNHHDEQLRREYVRILLNDAVVPLLDRHCGALGLIKGLCALDDFVAAQSFSLNGGNWEEVCSVQH